MEREEWNFRGGSRCFWLTLPSYPHLSHWLARCWSTATHRATCTPCSFYIREWVNRGRTGCPSPPSESEMNTQRLTDSHNRPGKVFEAAIIMIELLLFHFPVCNPVLYKDSSFLTVDKIPAAAYSVEMRCFQVEDNRAGSWNGIKIKALSKFSQNNKKKSTKYLETTNSY